MLSVSVFWFLILNLNALLHESHTDWFIQSTNKHILTCDSVSWSSTVTQTSHWASCCSNQEITVSCPALDFVWVVTRKEQNVRLTLLYDFCQLYLPIHWLCCLLGSWWGWSQSQLRGEGEVHPRQVTNLWQGHINRQTIDTNEPTVHVCGLREEARRPEENPHNKRCYLHPERPQAPSCCEVTMLTTPVSAIWPF